MKNIYGHGINGIQHKIPGWEQGTVGVNGNISMRLGREHGVPILDPSIAAINEPISANRFICLWLRDVPFLNRIGTDYWKFFFQDRVLEFNGINDPTINTLDGNTGSNKRPESFLSSRAETNGEFTLKVPNFRGDALRKLLKLYYGGIFDQITNQMTFYGRDLAPCKQNYSGDLLYILLGPTCKPDDIIFSALYLDAFPTKLPRGHLNSGERGGDGESHKKEDITFKGTYVENDTVNALAKIATEMVGLYKDGVNNQILPAYIYKKFFGGSLDELRKEYGADIKTKLQNDGAKEVYPEEIMSIVNNLKGN